MEPQFDSINTELLIKAKKNKVNIKEVMIKINLEKANHVLEKVLK